MSGTKDFTQDSAMSRETLIAALNAGRQHVDTKADMFIGGDMGIGNTSSASAIYSVLLKQAPEITVGPGTGVDKQGLARKRKALYQALNRHGELMQSPLDVLERVGGLEIAGLVGAYIACAQAGVPILIDGFITTAAALLACKINPSTRDWMMFSHKSAEPAHQLALESLKASPLLDLKMRLGEGSGAAVAAPIIISALALHSNMATFGSAGVSES
jgi:nicotinate-nucleotide--dimethylbenzimidazole phosphoribosyltransferase